MSQWKASTAAAMSWCLVTAHAHPEPATADWWYEIHQGDTLTSLTEHWLAPPTTWRSLQRLNAVPDPLRLKPGRMLRVPVAWLRREAGVAETVFVRGEVFLLRRADSVALLVGVSLRSGDRIRTGEHSSASLRFADGSRLLILPRTEVEIEQLLAVGREAMSTVRLGIVKGEADSLVTPNPKRLPFYEIRTPHVNLGVRGTEFRIQASAEVSRMQVLSGAVQAAGLSQTVDAGQGLIADTTTRSVSPLLPAPDLSTVGRVVDRLPLRLNWPAAPRGAVAWRAQLYAGGDFDRLLLDSRVEQAETAWSEASELPDGDYSLRVRAIDAKSQEGMAADVSISLQARPEPPFILDPSPGFIGHAGRVALVWTRNASAPRAQLQIARDAAFQDLALNPPAITEAGYRASLPDGVYHWRVASVEATGRVGPFGNPQTFELRPPPPSPPPAERELGINRLKLRWRPDPGVLRYELELAKTKDFSDAGVARYAVGEPLLDMPTPPPGTYYLRARGFNAEGAPSAWSQTQVIEQPYSPWRWLLLLLLVPFL